MGCGGRKINESFSGSRGVSLSCALRLMPRLPPVVNEYLVFNSRMLKVAMAVDLILGICLL